MVFYMNTNKRLALALGGLLLGWSLAGCSAAAAPGRASPLKTDPLQAPGTASPSLAAVAEGGGAPEEICRGEQFKPYKPFGLTYDAGKNELRYNGKLVRWFEDHYTIADGLQAGQDFFDANGVVDVYAVRDFTGIARFEDGSFDPGGTLVGLKEFSQAEFDARDLDALQNPPPAMAFAGGPPSAGELAAMAKEYAAFGVTYDAKNDQWYFEGEKVRFFRDVLVSNGESLTGGHFKGTLRTLGSADGTIDLYTVRDFSRIGADGYGTLTSIERCSQAEFDEHTQREMQSRTGVCTSAD